jgi:rifampicin phosphotransferase
MAHMETQDLPTLDEAAAVDAALVGGKAATLAGLRAAGSPVPDGFVVPPWALDQALAAGGLGEDSASAQVASVPIDEGLAARILGAAERLGAPFAVRSSGADEDGDDASHAGQYDSFLGVAGGAPLLRAIRACWASAFSDRARAYRSAHGLPRQSRLAVLVQRLVPADAAGVAFTANPLTGARDEVVVSVVRGLGDRLVVGEMSPEDWVARQGVASRRSAREGALDAAQARAVAELARRVQAHQGVPQDIEWAPSGGQLFLLQARAVTALPEAPPEPVPVPVEPPPGHWTREATHAPLPRTPFSRSIWGVRNAAVRDSFAEMGLLGDGIEFRDIGGWEYVRLVPLGGRDRPPLHARVHACVTAMRADVPGQLIERWYQTWLPELAGRIARLRDAELAAYPDDELDRHLGEAVALFDEAVHIHMRLHGALAIILAELAFSCRDMLGWDEAQTFALLAGLSPKSTEPSDSLADLAELARARPAVRQLLEHSGAATARLLPDADPVFARAFAAYQRAYGCRALRYELADPTLAELPELTVQLVRDHLATGYDPRAEVSALAARRDQAARAARRLLAGRHAADRDRFERALARAERAYPVREDNVFFTISAPMGLLRLAALELGRRLAGRGHIVRHDDVFFLEPAEARDALRSGADHRELVARRRGERAGVLAHPGPVAYGNDPGPLPSFEALPPRHGWR